MSIIILIILIIILLLIWKSFKKLRSLLEVCKKTNKSIKKLSDNFDTEKAILKSQKEQLQDIIDEISKIVYGNDESLVKISKIIELLRKHNNSYSK